MVGPTDGAAVSLRGTLASLARLFSLAAIRPDKSRGPGEFRAARKLGWRAMVRQPTATRPPDAACERSHRPCSAFGLCPRMHAANVRTSRGTPRLLWSQAAEAGAQRDVGWPCVHLRIPLRATSATTRDHAAMESDNGEHSLPAVAMSDGAQGTEQGRHCSTLPQKLRRRSKLLAIALRAHRNNSR